MYPKHTHTHTQKNDPYKAYEITGITIKWIDKGMAMHNTEDFNIIESNRHYKRNNLSDSNKNNLQGYNGRNKKKNNKIEQQ